MTYIENTRGTLEERAILPKGGKWFKNFKEGHLS